jgi:hypothetical protein
MGAMQEPAIAMGVRSFLVHVTTPWPPFNYKFGPIQLASDSRIGLSDALLCVWRPMPLLQGFSGPKCLYNCEPVTNGAMGARDMAPWIDLLDTLGPDGWLYHAHPEAALRVPHVTHRRAIQVLKSDNRQRRVVAVISNCGGKPRQRWDALVERNTFGTANYVDLYGNPRNWRVYQATQWSFPRRPKSYCGPIQGGWGDDAKVRLMAKYHAALCLENTQEPYYFTEKFLDAVAAGCVPIYRAHPSVRETYLQGARWIDPADHGDDVEATIEAALSTDRHTCAEQNARWLKSPAVVATSEKAVFLRVATILHTRATQTQP